MNMKILFGAVVFFVCVVTQAATPSFNSFDLTQFQTNGLVIRAKSGMLLTNPIVNSGIISGNGGGLTNLAGLTNVPVSINVTYNGKVTFNTNIYVQQLNWSTNAMSTITINANKAFEFLSTNNSIAITGFSGVEGTNAQAFTRIFTNTAGPAAVKSITLPVGTLMLSSPWTNVVYNTNQGILSGVIYPGAGTNCSWTGN